MEAQIAVRMLGAQGLSSQVKITGRKLRTLVNDTMKSAEIVSLVYVRDSDGGITRHKKGKNFVYKAGNKIVKDEQTLFRIRSLVIPPAWTDVWICALPEGHIQATGFDARGRKQYRYHHLWSRLRSETKFFSLFDFGKALPQIRQRIESDLALPGLPLNKVLAAIVSVMEYTGIRVGSSVYKKMYGSFGLTTLHDNHIRINGSEMQFSFRGKKGVSQKISLRNKKLAKIIRQCRDIPGKELFQYYDEAGNRRVIESGMVNSYIREISGSNFTSKHFRTWLGTLYALEIFIESDYCETATAVKKTVVDTLDEVAKKLGNTRAVCRKYYVHPVVIQHYSNANVAKFIKQYVCDDIDTLSLKPEEHVLMNMLEKAGNVLIEH